MLMILAPSKRQRVSGDSAGNLFPESFFSYPQWMDKAAKVVKIMRSFTPHELAHILQVSDMLAVKEAAHFNEWDKNAVSPQALSAVMMYDGDVYRALEVQTLTKQGWDYLDGHLLILSALYGVLKPFDLIQPYRLDFSAMSVRPEGVSLYDYWKKPVIDSINRMLNDTGSKVLVNLASAEFAKMIDKKLFDGEIVTPVFQEMRHGKPRVMGLYAKQARGLMVRYAAENGISNAEDLKSFDLAGYVFNAASSRDDVWMFRR